MAAVMLIYVTQIIVDITNCISNWTPCLPHIFPTPHSSPVEFNTRISFQLVLNYSSEIFYLKVLFFSKRIFDNSSLRTSAANCYSCILFSLDCCLNCISQPRFETIHTKQVYFIAFCNSLFIFSNCKKKINDWFAWKSQFIW